MGEELDALVAPTLAVGMAQHHLGFPGTVSLRPSTLIALVRDVVVSLTRHGFERLFFLNGHGGNVATVEAAFNEVHAERSMAHDGDARPAVRCKLQNWWDCDAVAEISEECFGDAEGMHATGSEISLTYHAYPEDGRRVHRTELTPKVAPVGVIHDSRDYRQRFPDGRIGSDPTLATPEIGERLYLAAVEAHSAAYEEFLVEV